MNVESMSVIKCVFCNSIMLSVFFFVWFELRTDFMLVLRSFRKLNDINKTWHHLSQLSNISRRGLTSLNVEKSIPISCTSFSSSFLWKLSAFLMGGALYMTLSSDMHANSSPSSFDGRKYTSRIPVISRLKTLFKTEQLMGVVKRLSVREVFSNTLKLTFTIPCPSVMAYEAFEQGIINILAEGGPISLVRKEIEHEDASEFMNTSKVTFTKESSSPSPSPFIRIPGTNAQKTPSMVLKRSLKTLDITFSWYKDECFNEEDLQAIVAVLKDLKTKQLIQAKGYLDDENDDGYQKNQKSSVQQQKREERGSLKQGKERGSGSAQTPRTVRFPRNQRPGGHRTPADGYLDIDSEESAVEFLTSLGCEVKLNDKKRYAIPFLLLL